MPPSIPSYLLQMFAISIDTRYLRYQTKKPRSFPSKLCNIIPMLMLMHAAYRTPSDIRYLLPSTSHWKPHHLTNSSATATPLSYKIDTIPSLNPSTLLVLPPALPYFSSTFPSTPLIPKFPLHPDLISSHLISSRAFQTHLASIIHHPSSSPSPCPSRLQHIFSVINDTLSTYNFLAPRIGIPKHHF